MTKEASVADVASFLDQYIVLWGSERFGDLYHAPCITLRADGSIHCLSSREAVDRFFRGLAQTYHGQGARRWKYSNVQVVPLGARSMLVTLDWDMMREDGALIRRWRQSYNLVHLDERLCVLVSTIH